MGNNGNLLVNLDIILIFCDAEQSLEKLKWALSQISYFGLSLQTKLKYCLQFLMDER